jgi:hypothetical protein
MLPSYNQYSPNIPIRPNSPNKPKKHYIRYWMKNYFLINIIKKYKKKILLRITVILFNKIVNPVKIINNSIPWDT